MIAFGGLFLFLKLGDDFSMLLLVICLLLSASFSLWAVWGGPYGRWIACLLLIGTAGCALGAFVGTPLYYGYDKDSERIYMTKIGLAIEQGIYQIPLEHMIPFNWLHICVVDAPYNEIPDDQQRAIARMTGVNVSGWRTEEGQPLMIFGTVDGPVLVRDDSEHFVDYIIGLISRKSMHGQICHVLQDGVEVRIRPIK